ncbi:MAG: hypothetical protein M3Q56_08370 [Bacteroidota bacterium]|nr:hypothetical protein [Bacteroidota bacterium]
MQRVLFIFLTSIFLIPLQGSPKGIQLISYNEIRTIAASSQLLNVINHNPGYPSMPPGRTKLPAYNIYKITAWVNQGMKNN